MKINDQDYKITESDGSSKRNARELRDGDLNRRPRLHRPYIPKELVREGFVREIVDDYKS